MHESILDAWKPIACLPKKRNMIHPWVSLQYKHTQPYTLIMQVRTDANMSSFCLVKYLFYIYVYISFIWLVILGHIIYFPKSCWNQAITLKDILENIPKPLGEKPEGLVLIGYNAAFENNSCVVKLGWKLGPSWANVPGSCALCIWLHFKGQRLSELLFSSLDGMVKMSMVKAKDFFSHWD